MFNLQVTNNIYILFAVLKSLNYYLYLLKLK